MGPSVRARERLLESVERAALAARSLGLSRLRVEDEFLDGDAVTIEGRRLVNFGSCAYLGLNTDRRLKDGAIRAIERFGPVFSSSTVYTSVPLFTELEGLLRQIFGAPVVVPATTTLGHLGVLPLVIGPGDAVVLDAQSHASIHLTTQVLAAQGTPIHIEPHAAWDRIEDRIAELTPSYDRVWFIGDGVYSMVGDVVPMDKIDDLLERYPRLRVYLDDAHGFSWQGAAGRGHVLNGRHIHDRMIVAVSLAKGLGAGGAAIVFADPAEAQLVQLTAGTLMFSGPLHPAELGAAVAGAEILLSDEYVKLNSAITEQIAFVRDRADHHGVPLANRDESPLWFVKSGGVRQAMELTRLVMDDGYYVNVSTYPAVSARNSGVRLTTTLYHDESQIDGLMGSLARNLAVVATHADEIDLRGA